MIWLATPFVKFATICVIAPIPDASCASVGRVPEEGLVAVAIMLGIVLFASAKIVCPHTCQSPAVNVSDATLSATPVVRAGRRPER